MCLGIPGRIASIRDDAGLTMGVVDFGGVRREVCLQYVADEVAVGDYVIVHVGFAITKVDEEEARRTFEVLKEMSQLEELEWMAEVADASLSRTQKPDVQGAGESL
ncbi:MAG TPA: HypC/HybG/HupF family hydrogenase formation chaperone [Gemmatimonadaceae bacterium]|jgi:hydrogenase expression/formation protein HypC